MSAFALMDFFENLLALEMAKKSEMDNADFVATSLSMSVLLKRFVIVEPLIILSRFSWNSHQQKFENHELLVRKSNISLLDTSAKTNVVTEV